MKFNSRFLVLNFFNAVYLLHFWLSLLVYLFSGLSILFLMLIYVGFLVTFKKFLFLLFDFFQLLRLVSLEHGFNIRSFNSLFPFEYFVYLIYVHGLMFVSGLFLFRSFLEQLSLSFPFLFNFFLFLSFLFHFLFLHFFLLIL
jgi:hypothetical protein